jgi:hypothetical protein
MAKFKVTLCVLTVTILSGCFTDTLDTVSFKVSNEYDKAIQVKLSNYLSPGQSPTDTIFTVLPGERILVYHDEGLVLRKERYIESNTLVFSDGAELSSETVVSSRNLLSEDEWKYKRIDDHGKVYTLYVNADDF